MNLKKLAASAACLMMLAALSACGTESISTAENSKPAETQQTQQSQQSAETTTDAGSASAGTVAPTFSFTFNGTEIKINDESDPIVAALGTPKSQFDAPSCAFDGTSYTYEYPGFKIETYPDGSTNRVYAVTLTDATVATAEGLKVGDDADTVKAKLGEPASETNSFIQYSTDGVDLIFFFDDKQIVYTYHLS